MFHSFILGRLLMMVFYMPRGAERMGLDLSLKLGRTVSAPRGTYTRLGDGFQKLKTHLLKKGAAEHTLGKIENILASKYESLLGYLDVR